MPSEGTGSLRRILTVTKNAFREAVRDRILYNLIIFVLLITVSAIFLGELTGGEEARVIVNLGLSATLVFGAFISIFVGVSLVWKEIEKKTVYSVLSKPVGRGEFIVGKYLGLCVTLLANLAVMAAGVSAALVYVGGSRLVGGVVLSAGLIFMELTIITAIAILFSSFSTPALSALLTFFVFIIGHFSRSLLDVASELGSSSSVAFFTALYYMMPNLSHFSFISQAANGMLPTPGMLGGGALYATLYNIILLTLTVIIFRRRNFK